MLWRLGKQLLVHRGGSFFLVDPSGAPAGGFHTHLYSDEDDLWRTEPSVNGDRLLERTTMQHGGDEARLIEQKVLLTGLLPCEEPKARELADAALAQFDLDQVAGEQTRQQEAEARVTAIPGARSELGLGPDAARAQLALCGRISRWNDERASELLRTLFVIAKIGPSEAVVTAFARACLFACFEHDVPAEAKSSAPTPNPALASQLEAHARQLEEDADGQERVDAMGNAAAFWRAAKALRVAVKLLS